MITTLFTRLFQWIVVFCTLHSVSVMAQEYVPQKTLAGFRYGTAFAPMGKEWQSPEDLSLNKELPRSYSFCF